MARRRKPKKSAAASRPQRPAPGASQAPFVSPWIPGIVQRVAKLLPPNEVACTLRLVDKATAALLREPQHTTVYLSQPVPEREFARRWGTPARMRTLTYDQRRDLLHKTVGSGVIANAAVLVGMREYFPSPKSDATRAAAREGQLEMLRWLHERGFPLESSCHDLAAADGHLAVCKWLLGQGCSMEEWAPYAAARGGQVAVLDWMLGLKQCCIESEELLKAMARGCDLAALQRVHRQLDREGRLHFNSHDAKFYIVAAAASSPTPDWQAKVQWLEGLGYHLGQGSLEFEAASCQDALERVKWLEARGYRMDGCAVREAAAEGNVDLLQHILRRGLPPDWHGAARSAAREGRLEALQLLRRYGEPISADLLQLVPANRLDVLAWLVELLGPTALTTEVFSSAAAKENGVQMMEWLRERGCPWNAWAMASAAGAGRLDHMVWLYERGCPMGEAVFKSAAAAGSEVQLEWLGERGCPMPDTGALYLEPSRKADLSTLSCLRRLGCPWGPVGRVFTEAIALPKSDVVYYDEELDEEVVMEDDDDEYEGGPVGSGLLVLRWLLANGCPVDWEAAQSEGLRRRPYHPEEYDWIVAQARLANQKQDQEQQQRQQQQYDGVEEQLRRQVEELRRRSQQQQDQREELERQVQEMGQQLGEEPGKLRQQLGELQRRHEGDVDKLRQQLHRAQRRHEEERAGLEQQVRESQRQHDEERRQLRQRLQDLEQQVREGQAQEIKQLREAKQQAVAELLQGRSAKLGAQDLGLGLSDRQPEGGPQAQQLSGAAVSGPSRMWLPHLVVTHIASFLPPNEVACTLRLVDNATAALLREPQHTTVYLSQPVPEREFARRWGTPARMRTLTYDQRRELLSLTAGTGVIANAAVLVGMRDYFPFDADAAYEAAEKGQLEMLRWLQERGFPFDDAGCFTAAAGGGHLAVCEWLLGRGCHWDMWAPSAAAQGGHAGVLDFFLRQRKCPILVSDLLEKVAHGCSLRVLQRVHRQLVARGRSREVGHHPRRDVLAAAAGSPTRDWQAKVQWLESVGYNRGHGSVTREVVTCEDAVARLDWLEARGYLPDGELLVEAASEGKLRVLRHALEKGAYLPSDPAFLRAAVAAARDGHLSALQLLHAHGVQPVEDAFAAAASGGHVAVLSWLAEALGRSVQLTAAVYRAAAEGTGGTEVLTWLRERRCPWDDRVLLAAAGAGRLEKMVWLVERGCPMEAALITFSAAAGSEAQLEWLVARGCPMPTDGEAYRLAGRKGDLSMIACLRRLGVPSGSSVT